MPDARFSNIELSRVGEDLAALRGDPGIARFLSGIEGKDPDFHAPTFRRR